MPRWVKLFKYEQLLETTSNLVGDGLFSGKEAIRIRYLKALSLYKMNRNQQSLIEFKWLALNTQGDDLGAWVLEDTAQSDWEALSDFVLDGQPYLLIADVGDNFRWKPVHSLIVVKEPDVGQPEERTISEEWRIDFSYPDGVFRDCEAVAVDQSRDRVLLLTKRVHPPELYSLPLKASSSAVAQKISDLFHLPRATHADVKEEPGIGKYRRMVTGMDVSEDDLLLTTYQDLYLYKLSRPEEAPVMVRMPLTGQREAVAFDRRSSLTAYVTNERRSGVGAADVFKIELPEF